MAYSLFPLQDGVLTDRFARTDGSTTAACNTGSQIYCGGTRQGIINHLDYIQNMGFTAVGDLSYTKSSSASARNIDGAHTSLHIF